jgi:predicted transcriptional regulator
MLELSDPTKYNLFNAHVLDYKYPKIENLPTLVPIDEAKSKLNQTTNKIKNKMDEYESIIIGVDSINTKIQQFKNIQDQFDINFNTLSSKRDKLVDEIMNKIGVSNVEQFQDQILLNNIMNNVNEKVNVRNDEKLKKGLFRSNLIVAV